jgi:hypothetical protein
MSTAESNTADRRSLQLLGFGLSALTVAVTLMAVVLVKEHAEGRLNLAEVSVASNSVLYSVR